MKHNREEFIKQHLSFANIVYANLPVGISIYDNVGDLIYVNDKIIEIFGFNDESHFEGFSIFNDSKTPLSIMEKIRNGENAEYELVYNFDEISKDYATSIRGIKILLIKAIIIRNKEGVIEGYLNICEDITHKKKNAELLAAVNLKFLRFINFMISGVEIYDSEGVMVDCNEYELKIFGIDNKEEFLSKKLSFFNNPNMPVEYTRDLRNGKDIKFELLYDFDLVKKHNYYTTSRMGKIWVEAKGSPIVSDSDELLGYIIETNDITQKKRQELQLKELHKNLELSLRAGYMSAWKYNIQGKYFKALLGKAVAGDGLSYGQVEEIMHPDDRRMMLEAFEDLISGRKSSCEFIVRFYDKEYGDYKYYESEMDVRKDIEGKITDIVGTQRDITEKCLKKLELDNARKSFDMVMESSNVLAWDYDILTRKYHILYGNNLMEKHAEIANYKKGTHPEDLIKYHQLIEKLKKGELEQGKIDIRIKDAKAGIYRSFEHTISSVKNPDGKVVGFIGSMYDMTERNKQKDLLEEQTKKTELINAVCNIYAWDYNPRTHILISQAPNTLFRDKEINLIDDKDSFADRIHPQDRDKTFDFFNTLSLMELETSHLETRLLFPNQPKYTHIVADGVAIRDKKGDIIKYSGINQNVDEWIKLNETLKEQNITHNIILNNVNSLMFYADENEEVKWDNMGSYSDLLVKMDMQDLVKNKKCKFRKDDICQRFGTVCLVSEAVKTKQIQSRDVSIGKLSVQISAIPVLDDDNNVLGTLHKIEDITESQAIKSELIGTKNKLEEANKLLNEIIDNVPCALYIKDSDDDLKFVRANKIFCDYVGRSIDQVVGKTDYEIFKKVNADLHVKKDKYVVRSRKMSIYDEEIDTFDGKRFWRVIKSSILSADNHLYVIGISLDITALKEVHNKLKKTTERAVQANLLLNEIISRIPVPMFVIDVKNNLRYTIVNSLFAKIVNRTVDELVGKNDYELFDKEVADMHRVQDQRLIDGENLITYDRIIKRGNRQIYLSVARSIIRTKEGNSLIIGILSDITKLRKINLELEYAKAKADESNRLKSAFLANMSHEIRTPLNAIVGFSELMSTSEDKEDKNEYMKIINTNNELLLRLIGDILDLSKIESGAVDLKMETFDLSAMFEEMFTTLKPRCEKSEVKLLSSNPFKKCIVTLDKNRCMQIVTNYINNAVKYTQSGYIKLGYDYRDEGIYIFVEDTGIGISEDKMCKLFQRFEKLDDFAQGTGLGLSICKAIAEKMEGKVGAESTEGKGSKFWAWLPCKAEIENLVTSNIEVSAEMESPARGCSGNIKKSVKDILVAEDNDSNYMLVEAILKHTHLTRAINGEEAVKYAKQYKYDAILMDLKMPVMGGLDATRRIREFDQETIIVALTANAFDSDKEEAIQAGCNSFVAKPLKRAELESAISGCSSDYEDKYPYAGI
jgi:PAS domain S-box-containing protein